MAEDVDVKTAYKALHSCSSLEGFYSRYDFVNTWNTGCYNNEGAVRYCRAIQVTNILFILECITVLSKVSRPHGSDK